MMGKTRVAINGFGRIGRMVFRQAIVDEELEVVAINASYPLETLAHLIKYDSIHGVFDKEVKILDDGFEINGRKCSEMTPSINTSPPVIAAAAMNVPASMRSLMTVCSVPYNASTPSMRIVPVPTPRIFAPIAFK